MTRKWLICCITTKQPNNCLSVCMYATQSLYIYQSIYLSIYLSIDLSISMSLSLYINLSVCLSVFLYVGLSVTVSLYISVCLSVCRSFSMYVCMYVCISMPVILSGYTYPMIVNMKLRTLCWLNTCQFSVLNLNNFASFIASVNCLFFWIIIVLFDRFPLSLH